MTTSSSIPRNAATFKEEGDVLYRDKRYQAAVAKYSKAIELLFPLVKNHRLDSDSALQTLYVSYSNRCACFLQLNSAALALRDAQECVRLKPDWPKGYLRLGSSHARLSQNNDAMAAYEQVLLLDSGNQEALNALNRLRNPTSQSRTTAQNPSFFTQISEYIGSINWQNIWHSITQQAALRTSQLMSVWLSLTQQTRNYIQIGVISLIAYYFLFYRLSSYDPSYDSYAYSSYSSNRGLTWTTWGLLMLAGYKLPPMFPEQLGEQYARPFFGLNFTTFMWLVNMFSRSGAMGGSGFGGGRGGGYNRRRYY